MIAVKQHGLYSLYDKKNLPVIGNVVRREVEQWAVLIYLMHQRHGPQQELPLLQRQPARVVAQHLAFLCPENKCSAE